MKKESKPVMDPGSDSETINAIIAHAITDNDCNATVQTVETNGVTTYENKGIDNDLTITSAVASSAAIERPGPIDILAAVTTEFRSIQPTKRALENELLKPLKPIFQKNAAPSALGDTSLASLAARLEHKACLHSKRMADDDTKYKKSLIQRDQEEEERKKLN